MPVAFDASEEREIVRALTFAKEFNLDPIIVGGAGAANVIDELKAAKARVIAPLVVLRRGDEDFLVLTEPGLGDVVRAHLTRMRLRARCEIEQEQHESVLVFGASAGFATDWPGVREAVDAGLEPTLSAEELELRRVELPVTVGVEDPLLLRRAEPRQERAAVPAVAALESRNLPAASLAISRLRRRPTRRPASASSVSRRSTAIRCFSRARSRSRTRARSLRRS